MNKSASHTGRDPFIGQVREELARDMGSDYDSREFENWNHIIQYVMLRRQFTLATAESCTGEYIASQITGRAGFSGPFLGSFESSAHSVKANVLGVSSGTLLYHGAVSTSCAEEMLDAVLRVIGSDVAVAGTAIAGPDEGS